MRLYSFTNFYLSSIQHGIQTAHCVSEMFAKYYQCDTKQAQMLIQWCENHKTVCCLNGGNNEKLLQLYNFFDDINNPYPYVKFHEDQQSLNGTLTAVSIIIPEKLYITAEIQRMNNNPIIRQIEERFVEENLYCWETEYYDSNNRFHQYKFTDWEQQMIQKLIQSKLA